jgi:murein DD-endopeptidase MepM/ murein hydrolase activator NlpD
VAVLRLWPIRFLLAGALLATATASALAVSSSPENGAYARIFAVKISIPNQGVVASKEAAAPPATTLLNESFSFPGDGSIVHIDSITGSAAATSAELATAAAAVSMENVQLFNGEIGFQHLLAAASAVAASGRANGDISSTTASGATYQGQPLSIEANGRIQLGDWGYMQTLVQTVGTGDPGTYSYHQFLRALDLHVTADHGGLPAGSEIIVGWAEAFAQASIETETVTIPASGPQQASTQPEKTPSKKPSKKNSKIVRPIPPDLQPKLNREGYVFPVYGQTWYSDSFGVPRADTGWHHGIDIFAPMGTPVLAVADGTVFSVGWNNLGGNRLWLRDGDGNEFYYAHLSAYSPLAVNRLHVKAGAVLGFIGNSGDAITTPPHLHFEAHAAALIPLGYDRSTINPYYWLVGLEHLLNVEFPAGTADWAKQLAARVGTQQAGAVLLHSTDISALPRLDKTSLKHLLEPTGYGTAVVVDRG